MSHTSTRRTAIPPKFWVGKPEELARKLSSSVREILDGKTNNQYTVTLEAGATKTEIDFTTAKPGVSVLLTPQNAVAAAFQRTTDVYAVGDFGKVVVNHDASAAGTEKFSLVIVG